MRTVQYQNHLRKIHLEEQQKPDKRDKKKPEEIKLLHKDWACKLTNMRLKFLPDFETLKKPMFGLISMQRIKYLESD